MDKMLENLEKLCGKEYTFSFRVIDDSQIWAEENKLEKINVLSTSALIEEIHKCAYKIIEENIMNPDFISVVSETSLKHISFTPAGFNCFIKIKADETDENQVYFSGEVFDETEKVAEFKIKRVIVSYNSLKRKVNNKLNKISK
ncbi:MAG: hypothetical protein H7A30_06785 [Thermotogae bacterium]|nr:hypothetical protein [Thermotogota bacterium]